MSASLQDFFFTEIPRGTKEIYEIPQDMQSVHRQKLDNTNWMTVLAIVIYFGFKCLRLLKSSHHQYY